MALELDATTADIKVFLEEGDEIIQLLDEDLVRLEREPDNVELLQEIFRAAHTLKGSSATIGHHKMATLTHAMETLLDKLRKRAVVVNTAMIDALLEAVDNLRVLEREIATSQESGIAIDDLVERLSPVAVGQTEGHEHRAPMPECMETAPIARTAISRPDAFAHVFDMHLRISGECPLPAARALQTVMALSDAGQICSSEPSIQEIMAEQIGSALHLVVGTCWDQGRVEATVAAVEDVTLAEISLLEDLPNALRDIQRSQSADGSVSSTPESPSNNGFQAKEGVAKKDTGRTVNSEKTFRIEVARVDALLNLVGELVTERTRLIQLASSLENKYGEDALVGQLSEATDVVGRITDQLQAQVMNSRMLPIDSVFHRLPRAVRDLALRMDKKVDLIIEGQETELDRSVIEELGDPLLHLLRNAVDHGLESPEERCALGKPESGTIKLTAAHEDNQVVISITDDGRGIDPTKVRLSAIEKRLVTPEAAEKLSDREAIRLVFAAGLSTAQQVSDVSGRGVGLDVVRTNIEKLNGSVDLDTEPGVGTRFTVRLPLTLAIIQALFVQVGDSAYAIPMVSVTETLRLSPSDIQTVRGAEAILHRGAVLPLLRVSQILSRNHKRGRAQNHCFVVAVKAGSNRVGLIVDSLLGEQDIVIKPLGTFLGDVQGISGATILGDGRVALIIDVLGLMKCVAEI